MSSDRLIEQIINRQLTGLDPATSLSDVVGWDSLKMVRLVLRIEALIGRKLAEAELETIQTVGDVKRLLQGARAP